MRKEKTVLLLVIVLATSFALTMNLKPVAANTLPTWTSTWTSASDAKVEYDWPTGPSTSWSYATANTGTMEETLMAQNDWGYAHLYYYFQTYSIYDMVDLKVFASELSYDLQYAGPVPGSGNSRISFEAAIYAGADKDHLGSRVWYTQFRYDVCWYGDLPVYISSMLWDKADPLSGSMPAGQYVLMISLSGNAVSGLYGTAVIRDYQHLHNGNAYAKTDSVQLTLANSWSARSTPTGHNYNFAAIPTPYGTGYHIDTIGYSDYSFNFLGYTIASYQVGSDGAIRVKGYFRQSDTFDSYLAPGRRVTKLYVMYSSDLSTIVKSVDILDYTDGTDWKYRDVVISGLNPNSAVTIGVGRFDPWEADWRLVAEWAGVQVSTVTLNWAGITSPKGHFMNSKAIPTNYGFGWHVDTQGSGDYGYQFYAYASQIFTVGADGKVTIQGWFRQYDTFSGGLENGRRVEYAFLVNPYNPSTIIQSALVSTYADGTGWVFKTVTFSGLAYNTPFAVAFGRQDYWSYDWQLTSEWAGVSIITTGYY